MKQNAPISANYKELLDVLAEIIAHDIINKINTSSGGIDD